MNKLSIILSFFLMVAVAHAQDPKTYTAEVDKICGEVKKTLPSLEKVVLFKDTTGAKTGYYKNKQLKLVTAQAYENGIDKNIEWYYDNDLMIYAEQNWYDHAKKQKFYSERFYLKNGHLFHWITQDGSVADTAS